MPLDAGSVEATLILDLDDRGFRDGDRKMAEWARKDSSAQLSFDVDDHGFDAADRKLHEWGMKSSTAELKFDVDRASLSRLIAGAGGAGRAIDSVGASAENAGGGLSQFGGTMQGLQWAGILAGAPAAAAALVNFGGAAISVGSALSSLSGLLITIPQGFLGFAQGAGTVAAATDGISNALKAYTTQQANADKTAQQATSHQTSGAQARAAASRQVATAEQQVADANRQVGAAERNLTVQHEATTQAQHALNLAVEQARRDMQDLQRQAIESATAEKQATLNLAEAQRALDKGLRDPTTGQLQLRQLHLNVVEARQAQTDAHIQATRAQQDNNQAQREGVQGQPNVVAAHQAVTQAIHAEADAHRQLEDAQRGVERATQNLDYQQKQAKLHIDQANQSMQTAATTANVYQQALEQLTPAQRQFTRFLVGTREKFEGLRQVAAKNLFPGVEQGITAALKNFPRLRRIVAETGQVLGHLANVVGKFLGSKQFGRDLSLFAGTNLKLFDNLARAGLHFAHGLELILRDAQPFIRWLGRLTEALGEHFNAWARTGHQTGRFTAFFKETQRTLPEVLHLMGNLFRLLTGIGEAAAPIGNKILQFFNRSLRAWADWSHSIVGQVELRAFFERLRVPFEDLLKLVAGLGKAFLDLFGSDRGQEMLDKLTKALIRMIPSVESIGETIVEIVSILGPSLLDLLNSFLTVIADGAPELEIFAKAIAFMADELVKLLDTVPGLSQLIGTIAAWGLAMAGVKWVLINSGIRDLGAGLYNVFKRGGLIEQAPGKVSAFMDALQAFPSNLKTQAGRVVAATKEVFLRIGSRLGLITGEKIAEDTVGGEVAGEAGGGLIGRMKGLMGRLRGRLGSLFRSLGSFLGLRVGEQVAVTTVEGEAAGAAGGGAAGGIIGRMRGMMGRLRGRLGSMFRALGTFLGIQIGTKAAEGAVAGEAAGAGGGAATGGLIGTLRSKMPRLTRFFEITGAALGTSLAIAIALGVGSIILAEFDKYVGPKIRSWLDDHIPGFSKVHGSGPLGSFSGPGGVGSSPTPTPGQTTAPDPQTASARAIANFWLSDSGGDPRAAIQALQHVPAGPNTARAIQILRRMIHHGGERGGVVTTRGIVGFVGGGVVGAGMRPPGPTDTVPAMLTPGEIVLPRKASQAIQNAVGPITAGTEKATKAILKLIRRDVSDSYAGLLSDVADTEDKLTKRNRDTWQQVRKDADDQIGERQGQNGTFWGDVYDAISGVGDSWDQVTSKMVDQTQGRFGTIAQIAQRQGKNFAGYVQGAMREASDATFQGTSYIADAVSKALKAFDSKSKFHLTVDKPNLTQHAQGGMIGGQGRQDTVPLLLGMAAPGEAILTRYQQGWVDTALRNTFGMGLGDLFATERRPHGYQQGGMIPTFATGGWTGGLHKGIIEFASAVMKQFPDLSVSSGFRTSMPIGHPDYHNYGDAVDLVGPSMAKAGAYIIRKGWYRALAEQINTAPNRVDRGQLMPGLGPIEPWNLHLAQTEGGPDPFGKGAGLPSVEAVLKGAALGGPAIGAVAMLKQIGKLKVSGTDGPLPDLVAAALGMERDAGNDYLRQKARAAGPGGFIQGQGGSFVRQAGSVFLKAGLDKVATAAILGNAYQESTWNPNSVEGAWGFHAGDKSMAALSTFASQHHVSASDPTTQANFLLTTLPTSWRNQMNNMSLADATAFFMSNWEIPDPALANLPRRIQGAQMALRMGYQRGGVVGGIEERLRHLTHIPAIRHLQGRTRTIEAQIRRQTHRLRDLPRHALRGKAGHALRQAIRAEEHVAHQIAGHIASLHRQARRAAPQIQHLDARLAGRLLPLFGRAEHMAEMGGDPSNLLRSLHIGRGIGSPALRSFAHARTSSIHNALAISRAQAPSLGGGNIFAQGGWLGSGLGLTNVSGGSQTPPIYLMLDADVAGFVGRVRAVQDGREVELARKVGLGRLTPGSIGRKAVYAVPRR